MQDKHNLLKNIRIFIVSLTLSIVGIQFSRSISPLAVVDDSSIFLAWLPLCVMFSVLFLFGRRGIAPIILAMMATNHWNLHLPLMQAAVLLFCQTFSVLGICGIVRWQVGARWRHGLPDRNIWLRIFWLGFVA